VIGTLEINQLKVKVNNKIKMKKIFAMFLDFLIGIHKNRLYE